MKLFFIVIFHVIVVYTLPGKNQKNSDALLNWGSVAHVRPVYSIKLIERIMTKVLKGIVQRKLRWVEIGIKR